jgi:hypothetical protein
MQQGTKPWLQSEHKDLRTLHATSPWFNLGAFADSAVASAALQLLLWRCSFCRRCKLSRCGNFFCTTCTCFWDIAFGILLGVPHARPHAIYTFCGLLASRPVGDLG